MFVARRIIEEIDGFELKPQRMCVCLQQFEHDLSMTRDEWLRLFKCL